jgi:mycothiol synthase
MTAEPLSKERIPDFVAYCRKHRAEVDDSFLYDEDLREFGIDSENPTYILINEQGEVVGAVSLLIDDYRRRGKQARFRILHSEIERIESYQALMRAVLRHTEGLNRVQVFAPMANPKMIKVIEGLGFCVERYSFILVRDDSSVPDGGFPEGYAVKPFVPGRDEGIWCEVRNAGFATLRGNETPLTLDGAAKLAASEDYLEGGMMILFHAEKPVGVVRGAIDEYEGSPAMEIGPLAIIPEYQGKGLGRGLLRVALRFAKEKSFGQTILCVNAENERAKALYIQEGFKQVEAAVCYRYDLPTAESTEPTPP